MLTAQAAARRTRQQQQQRPRPDSATAQAAFVQQLGSARNITALYNAVISATVERCTQFQSPKVMDAIEKGSTAKPRPPSATAQASAGSFSTPPTSSVVDRGGSRGTAGSANHTGAGKPAETARSGERKQKPAEDEASVEGGEGRNHSSLGKGGPGEESEQGGAKREKERDVKSDSTVKEQTENPDDTERAGGDDDDDFADADVDEADASPVSTNQKTANDDQREASQDPVQKQGKQEKSTGSSDLMQVGLRLDLEDKEECLDDVSDLDDQEPVVTDGIYAMYEKVERCGSSGKKTMNWRITLRHGIIRAAGQEIGFDRLYGELKF